MPLTKILALILLVAPAIAGASLCFTLLDPQGQTIYRSDVAPIDLSREISEELRAKYPGHHLVFGDSDQCTVSVGGPGFDGLTATEIRSSEIPSRIKSWRHADPSSSYKTLAAYARTRGSVAQAGTDVNVRAYVRQDGTRVRAYTRADPGFGDR